MQIDRFLPLIAIGLGLYIGYKFIPSPTIVLAELARTSSHRKRRHHHIRTHAQQAHIRDHRRHSIHPSRFHPTAARHVGGQKITGDIPGHPEMAAGSDYHINDPIGHRPMKKFIGGELDVSPHAEHVLPSSVFTRKYPPGSRITLNDPPDV